MLFSYSSNTEKSEQLCKDRSETECHAVDVNFEAFLAPEMTVLMRGSGTITNSVESHKEQSIILSKRTQEGLETIMKKKKSFGTATVSYKSAEGSVVFVIKAGKVFGSIKESQDNVYGLEPCFNKENCHIWFKRNSSHPKNKSKIPKLDANTDNTFLPKAASIKPE